MTKSLVRQHKREAPGGSDGRQTMRTLADALNKLHELGVLAEDGQAEIQIAPMRLPDGSTAASVAVAASGRSVLMPSATHFTATDTRGALLRTPSARSMAPSATPTAMCNLLTGASCAPSSSSAPDSRTS